MLTRTEPLFLIRGYTLANLGIFFSLTFLLKAVLFKHIFAENIETAVQAACSSLLLGLALSERRLNNSVWAKIIYTG